MFILQDKGPYTYVSKIEIKFSIRLDMVAHF